MLATEIQTIKEPQLMLQKQIKQLFRFSICLLFGLSLFSCSKANIPLENAIKSSNKLVQVPKSSLLSDREAVEQAQKFYKKFFGNELRSAKVPKVKEVIRVSKSKGFRALTVGEKENSGLLIVNFENNKGYAIMSENKNSEPLFAITKQGNMEEEEVDNPISPIILNRVIVIHYSCQNKIYCSKCGSLIVDTSRLPNPPEGYQRPTYCTMEQCSKYLETGDTTPKLRFDPMPILSDSLEWKVVEQVPAMLRTKWHLGFPYNKQIPYQDGFPCQVGCVPIAVGQIMSHYRYPKLDWEMIFKAQHNNSIYQDAVSTFLYELGQPNLLDVKYGVKASGALDNNVPRTLRAYGYKCSDLSEYNLDSILEDLRNKQVLYMAGSTEKGRHAWVIDGFKIEEQKRTRQIKFTSPKGGIVSGPITDVTTKVYLHCNFGWGGVNDGYFLSKIFSTAKLEPKDFADEKLKVYYKYKYNFQIIKDIRR